MEIRENEEFVEYFSTKNYLTTTTAIYSQLLAGWSRSFIVLEEFIDVFTSVQRFAPEIV